MIANIKTTNAANARQTLAHFWHASLLNKHLALLSLFIPISAILTNVVVPFYAGKALTDMITNNGLFTQHVVYATATAVLGMLLNRVGFVANMKLQALGMSYLQALAFNRLLNRGMSFHINQVGGKLVSDALDFAAAYSTLLGALFINGVSFVFTLVVGLAVVLISSWQLGLFLMLIILVTITWAIGENTLRRTMRGVRLKAQKNLTAHLSDTLVNAQTVKTFAGEKKESKQHQKLNDTLTELRLNDWTTIVKGGSNRIGFLLLSLIALLLMINQLAKSDPTILSTGIFAFTYTFTLLIRLFEINIITRVFDESMLQASPMTDLLAQNDEINDDPNAQDIIINEARIVFDRVGFSYQDSQQGTNIFKTLDLVIKPGEKVGLVGPSGGGKTTLTRLLLRFEDIQSGRILIDDQNVREVTQTSLRRAISYVPQEPLLFHRSILENIAYGKPGSTDQEVRQAAKSAHAHSFITELSEGYNTIVGERGVKLSGGQRQRIAIARAILKNAPILVLDEATSALDSESEKEIQAALKELMKNKTTIVIAHRLSTIQKMDRIVVLDKGTITEQGSHATLLKKKGLYSKLWQHQSGGFLED